MRIRLARNAGFCWGVRRAMDAVLAATNKSSDKITTLGPLVHNHQAMEMLATKGVEVISAADQANRGVVFIRAHGVTPTERERLSTAGVEVRDLTCPHVLKAQKIVANYAKEGFKILIIGDAGHAEVNGLLGHAIGQGQVISTPADLQALPDMDKVCVVAQTTQDSQRFATLVPLLTTRFPEVKIHNTICNATDNRQAEVRKLAREVEAMVVVGGRHSANTVRLAEIAREEGIPTFLIETAAELDPRLLKNFTTVGITAGASTPHWVFREVEEELQTCCGNPGPVKRFALNVIAFFIYSYIFIGIGGAALTYAALVLAELPQRWDFLLISALYVNSMHLYHRFLSPTASMLNEPGRMKHLLCWRFAYRSMMTIFALGALALSFSLGLLPGLLMAAALAAGLGYNLPLVPGPLARRFGVKTLSDIPCSKDLSVALVWSLVTLVLPYLASGTTQGNLVLTVLPMVFLIVLIRSIVYNLKDLEGDRIMGKETIPIVLGRTISTRLVLISTLILAGLTGVHLWFAGNAGSSIILFPLCAYLITYLVLYHRRLISQGIAFELVVDSQFILAGLLSLLV